MVVHSSHGEASQTTLLDLCWRSGQVLSVQDVKRVLQDRTEIRYQYLNGSLRLFSGSVKICIGGVFFMILWEILLLFHRFVEF